MSRLKQHVNFYRDEFKTPEIALPAKQMIQIAGIVLIGFIVVGCYQVWSLYELQEKIKVHESRRDQLRSQYEQLEASFVEPTEDPVLLSRLKTLSNDVRQKQKLKAFLKKESSKSLFSFAAVLDGLANSDIRNIWLTQVKIKTSGNQYELRGVTQHAEAIPDYIEKLKEAEALKGTSFSVFNIERDKDSEAMLHFTLSSEQTNEQDEG